MALHAQTTDQLRKRWYCEGLATLISAIERADPKDTTVFKPILNFALELGITATSLADRVGHRKGTISKWINTDAMPSQPTREIVLEWLAAQAREKLEEAERLPDRYLSNKEVSAA
jgi:hypothetical protein